MTPSPELLSTLRRTSLSGLMIAGVGGAVCVLRYLANPDQFYPAYLVAFFYWMSIAQGCLVIALVHGITGGGWGRAIRRVIEAGYETIPLLALMFVPIWSSVANIYPWGNLEFVRKHESLVRKAGYLTLAGFQARAIVYFVIWIAISCVLNQSSPTDEQQAESPRTGRLQRDSGLGLIFYGFTFTLAAVDWMMSLEPQWSSTMYALIHIAGQAVSGLSFAVIVVTALGRFEPWTQIVTPVRLNDLGNLLLAAVMFWAYCSFFQYLVIWSGNLPEENVWYVRRSSNGWQYVVMALMAFHFAVPFLLLLSSRLKRQSSSMWRIAVLLLGMRYVDLYWLAIPGFQRGGTESQGLVLHWLDLPALAAIGGAWIYVFLWRLSIRIRLPMHDPELKEVADERS